MDNKKKFEVKQHLDPGTGLMRRDIFVDNELFEYEVDKNVLVEAQKLGPGHLQTVQEELRKHFLACLSEFVGKNLVDQDVLTAAKTGWI